MQSEEERKKLTDIGSRMLQGVEQADQLRELAKRNPEEASRLSSILDSFVSNAANPSVSDYQVKLNYHTKIEVILDLIADNITLATHYVNFNVREYASDRSDVFNLKMKVSSIGMLDKSDLVQLNVIYKKHLQIRSTLQAS